MKFRAAHKLICAAAAVIVISAGGVSTAFGSTSAIPPKDRTFLIGAHQSNLAEIAAGKLAQSKGVSQGVKNLGAMLVTDHTKLDAALRKVAAASSVTLPATPNPEQKAMQVKLQQASTSDFDAMFVAGQITGHAKAMQLGESEIASGSDPAVKKTAVAAAPVIAKHHHEFMAQAESMGLPTTVDSGLSGVAATHNDAVPAVLIGLGALLTVAGVASARRRRSLAG
jgi:putative membrane protein